MPRPNWRKPARSETFPARGAEQPGKVSVIAPDALLGVVGRHQGPKLTFHVSREQRAGSPAPSSSCCGERWACCAAGGCCKLRSRGCCRAGSTCCPPGPGAAACCACRCAWRAMRSACSSASSRLPGSTGPAGAVVPELLAPKRCSGPSFTPGPRSGLPALPMPRPWLTRRACSIMRRLASSSSSPARSMASSAPASCRRLRAGGRAGGASSASSRNSAFRMAEKLRWAQEQLRPPFNTYMHHTLTAKCSQVQRAGVRHMVAVAGSGRRCRRLPKHTILLTR